MFKVIDLNDTGKTKKLLEECSRNHGVFVCKHPENVDEKCKVYGIAPVISVRYDEYEKFADSMLYIDELERFVKCIAPNLNGYTLTKE